MCADIVAGGSLPNVFNIHLWNTCALALFPSSFEEVQIETRFLKARTVWWTQNGKSQSLMLVLITHMPCFTSCL